MKATKKKKTVLITLGNQKGGVGKTTLTTIICNYLHLHTEWNIMVIDTDDAQVSLKYLRDRDLGLIEESKDDEDSELYGIDPDEDLYPIITTRVSAFPDFWEEQYSNMGYDVIFVDFPGNIQLEGVLSSYALCDIIMFPFNARPLDFGATEKYLRAFMGLKDYIKPNAKMMGILNNIDKRTSHAKHDLADYTDVIEEMGYEMLKNYFPNGPSRYGEQANTVLAYDKPDSLGFKACQEIESIIRKKINS